MISSRIGVAVPAIVGGFVFWLPAWIVNREIGGEAAAVWWHTALMPAWCALLWWSFVATCTRRGQRVGVPLVSLAVAWLVGPIVLGKSSLFMISPLATWMVSAYTGTMLGLVAASAVVIALGLVGLRELPPGREGGVHESSAGA